MRIWGTVQPPVRSCSVWRKLGSSSSRISSYSSFRPSSSAFARTQYPHHCVVYMTIRAIPGCTTSKGRRTFPVGAPRYAPSMARVTKTQAVVLRSMRLGEADRVLHLYTLDRGRVGAVAKGIRRTKSRFGARLEPLSHVELMLHQGSGELGTVTGVDLVRSHHAAREQPYRLGVALVGAEAMLRLFTEQEANERAFTALTRFLDLVDELPPRPGSQPALDPLALAFQLKLLWVSGYLPHVSSCSECGSAEPLVGY